LVTTAASGIPPPIPLAKTTISGTTSCLGNPHKPPPTLPKPV